jgi:hypothetical protein
MMSCNQLVTALVFDGRYSLGSAPQRWRITMTSAHLRRLMVAIDGEVEAHTLTVKDFIARLRVAQNDGFLTSIEEILGPACASTQTGPDTKHITL